MQRDGHIRLLPLHVANKIAAGEVVERPASVLKELMENAIDAGATRIDVVVAAGGRNLVSVRDNGCGMAREDAILSLERQATSKIRDVDDIERIDTLGFRGEAIPSIAAVSRFTLVTRRPDDESGTRLVVNAGTLAEVSDCGAPPGTCVEVRDLFCNVPARRKFLRAFATEEGHMRSVFTVHALAHPDVGFSLVLDGRETCRFAPGATLEERIRDLFGPALSESLVPVATPPGATGSPVSIHGYIERPDNGTLLRHDQFTFVNGRPSTAAAISYALREACPRARAEARPAAILFIDLPPAQVDVNVHPAKREVRFRRPAEVREALIAAISTALQPHGDHKAFNDPADLKAPKDLTPPRFAVPFSSAPVPPPSPVPQPLPATRPVGAPPQAARPTSPAYLATTSTGYLLLETDRGIVTLNPRAARERIAYERLLERRDGIVSQPLLLPETIRLKPADSARIRSFLPELRAVGFAIEDFGRDVWKLDAVPTLAAGLSATELLATIAADVAEAGAKRGSTRWRDELVARSVARSYAGANVKLTREGAVKLVEELMSTRQPYVCPRNKPTMILTSSAELARKFDI
ncbi:MAG: DNA mismatch repair endonuclease MutL [Kiritimatiellae bacterium]|nr:DNA mismatch repair endonuclease MutL [Kiritimatiellia bacterium]